MTINFDFDYNCLVDRSWYRFLQKLIAAGASVVSFVEIGPGGGNPNVTIRCTSPKQVDLINDWCFGNTQY